KMGELGLMGITFPPEYGGTTTDFLSYLVALEEISTADAVLGNIMHASISLGGHGIYMFGSEEQKRKWLTPIALGEKLGSFGLTEPNVGTDAGSTQTHAKLDGDSWVINGSKNFISNAGTDMTIGTIITAVTDVVEGKNKISAIFVPKDTPGFTIGPNLDKIGWNHADTRNLYFQDVRVPKENLIGTRGQGFKQFLSVLNIARITVGVTALGLAQQCLNESLKYSKERTQFGQPISKFQLIQAKLADMATEIEAARQLMHYTAWLVESGKRYVKEASMFKYFVSEVARRAANEAVQIHGGYGYMMEYPVARAFRDYKVMEIGEGTSEVQKLIIARELGC
ncbi:MAG: acyl-CoA dehydrogenase family protein, partial [Desulfobacteraceae bacterium]|nr:acyl-CoA dehydrogenase family protein [Desulfobacteraceae bacterium]